MFNQTGQTVGTQVNIHTNMQGNFSELTKWFDAAGVEYDLEKSKTGYIVTINQDTPKVFCGAYSIVFDFNKAGMLQSLELQR